MNFEQLAARLAILHDMSEEGWPSMDQMGHLLTTRVPVFAPNLSAVPVRHRLVPLASPGPLRGVRPLFFVDRVWNRLVLYPRRVRRDIRGKFDIYHIVDHSYAQLALELPADSTIVTCHDVDTFRSLVEPSEHARSPMFRMMTRRILRGLRRARIVVCVSEAVRNDLVRFDLVDASRIRVVPNGIDPRFLSGPSEPARQALARLLPVQRGVFDVLHVGSDIPRKRLDRAITVVSALRSRGHWVRLVRVGPMRQQTRDLARELGLADFIELPFLDHDLLRAVYERCDVLLVTSDREGYGLPVLEAFAAGKPVVASDIPAIREASGGLAMCVSPDVLHDWVGAIERVFASAEGEERRAAARRQHAASFTWDQHVGRLLPIYEEVLTRPQRLAVPAQTTAQQSIPVHRAASTPSAR